MAGTVIFLGAGATKACGGPLTNEILPAILADAPAADPAGRLPRLHQFLQDQFHISANSPTVASHHFQSAPTTTGANCAWSPLALGTGKMNDCPVAPALNAFNV